MVLMPEDDEPRIIGLYGEIDEENSRELVGSLLVYLDAARKATEPPPTVELIISTGGGNVADMFAIYDAMRMGRELYDISPVALGKVMSAGVLLLAAGTPGQRRIGKHCRIMLHHVMTSEQGSLASFGSTYAEAEQMEQLMFQALSAETSLSLEDLQGIVQSNTDKFFSAEEAIEMGIADIIV